MSLKHFLIYFLVGSCFQAIMAQTPLSLTDAIAVGLENNYSILLARNSQAISSNNATIGNAGMLPSLTLTGTITKGVADSYMEFVDGRTQDRTGAKSTNMNGNLAFSWTIFDGLTMFADYKLLQELEKMGEENLRATIQRTTSSIITSYYDIVSRQQEIDALTHILRISKQRLRSANDMFQAGKVSKVDVLSAQVDYNADTASYIQQIEGLKTARIALNKLLARETNADFFASDSIRIDPSLLYGPVLDKSLAENPEIMLSRMSINASAFSLKAVQGSRYPQVRLTSSYTMTKNQSESGQVMENRSNNLNYGITASVPLFNGLNINRQIKNAKIEQEAANLRYEEMMHNVEAQVATAYSAYEVNRKLADFERDNLGLAQENLEISMDRYRLGAISAVALRDVQRSYISASNRLIVATYNAKVAETALKVLTGEVIKLE